MFQHWRGLTKSGFPSNDAIQKAWGLSLGGAKKRMRGDRPGTPEDWKVWAEKLLPLPQPEPAKEFLKAVARGEPPDKLEALADRLQQKGPGESLEEESPNRLQAQDSSLSGALPSVWFTPDKLRAAAVHQVATTKAPNWPLQMQVARSRLGIATEEELMHKWSAPALYDRLLLYCSDNPTDSLAQQALQALLRWVGPLVNPKLSFEAAAAGEFPEFQGWIESQVAKAARA